MRTTSLPSHTFHARDKTLILSERTALMGVVNVTPDSFYEGSRTPEVSEAIDVALALVEAGADIIDIGGESTRPGGEDVSIGEELERVLPVLQGVRESTDVLLSIDTRKRAVAESALEAGADIINDVTALADDGMAEVAARARAGVVLMHMRGTPKTMQQAPVYDDVVGEVKAYLRNAIERAEAAGVSSESILIDPGIGFGKTLEHNLTLLRELEALAELDKPILVGTSRKSFIARLLSDTSEDRIFGTAGSVAAAAMNGAAVVRVHDVQAMSDVVAVVDAIRRVAHLPQELAR
jgi:dihydropteroate synthase